LSGESQIESRGVKRNDIAPYKQTTAAAAAAAAAAALVLVKSRGSRFLLR